MKNTLQTLQKKRKSKKGFTLMEMLIVVAIIAILVAIAIPTFNGSLDRARVATDDANIRAAYAQYQVNELVGSATATVGQADADDVKQAFEDIGVNSFERYDTITVPKNGSKWIGSGTGKKAISAATITIES